MYTEFHPDSGAEKTEAGAYSLYFVASGHKGHHYYCLADDKKILRPYLILVYTCYISFKIIFRFNRIIFFIINIYFCVLGRFANHHKKEDKICFFPYSPTKASWT